MTCMKIRVIKHEVITGWGSYEVRFPDRRPSKYFYFENLPGRRLRPDPAARDQRVVCSGALLDESLCGRGRHLPVVQSILWFVKRANADANAY